MKRMIKLMMCICVFLMAGCTAEKTDTGPKVKYTNRENPAIEMEIETDDETALTEFTVILNELKKLEEKSGEVDITEGFDSIQTYVFQKENQSFSYMDFDTPHQDSTITDEAIYVEVNDNGNLQCFIVTKNHEIAKRLLSYREYFGKLLKENLK